MKTVPATLQNSHRHVVSTLKNKNLLKAYVAVPLEKAAAGRLGYRGLAARRSWAWQASAPRRPVGGPQQQLGSRLVQAGVSAVRGLVRLGHAGAAHRDGDVVFGVHGAAPRAGSRAAQHHGRGVDRRTAKAEVLLSEEPRQAAAAQAVGLRQVPWKASRVVGNSVSPASRRRKASRTC